MNCTITGGRCGQSDSAVSVMCISMHFFAGKNATAMLTTIHMMGEMSYQSLLDLNKPQH